MKLTTLLGLSSLLLFSTISYGQKGKDGVKIVSTLGKLVNDYTYLTANASAGSSTITVANSGINTLGLFAGNLSAGDLIMIIQMQGATISSSPNDSTWGTVTSYNNCGLNEIKEVQSVPNGTTIKLNCPLANNYTALGNVEVVRIPRYVSLTVNIGSSVSCVPWNGQIGGIIAVEVQFNTIVNGNISASWMGFRGGVASNNSFTYGVTTYYSTNHNMGAEKGEGIAGFELGYNIYGGGYCRGAAANGGGGANSVNAGGGGGANAGNIAGYNGNGNPDISNPSWISAWNLEYPGFATNVSSGGGRGGYAWGNCGPNPLTVGPGNAAWLGDNRNNHGGKGGRPLDYSTGRLFLGGGGGAGDENNGSGSSGAPGGGLIYILNYGTISGTDSIVSNGKNALPALFNGSAEDGGGGGGGGGTIILNSTGTISGVVASAMGGKGADQIELTDPYDDVEGTAGGGGGGYIAISSGVITELVTGGKYGTSTWPCMSPFPQDGATMGGPGLLATIPGNSAAVTVSDTNLCKGDSVHFSGFANFGSPYTWTWTFPGGTPSSSSLQNPVISYSSSGTYTVKLVVTNCIGADTVTKNIHITLTTLSIILTGLDSICPGQTDSIKANAAGATNYTWTGGVTCPSCAATSANPLLTTTYSLTVSNGTCSKDTTFTVNLKPLPVPGITAKPDTICAGDSVKLTGSGGGTYFWPVPGTPNNPIYVKPATSTTYTLQVTKGGCTASTTKQVFVGPSIIDSLILRKDSICASDSTYLVAIGGVTYKWSPGGATTDSIKVKQSVTTTYKVIIANACGTDTLSKKVNVVPLPVITSSGNTIICKGANATLSATGGISYLWSPGGSTGSSIIVSPASTQTYTVAVSNGKCIKDTTITVTVNNAPVITITPPAKLCKGDSIMLTATGGGTYKWSNGATTSSVTVRPAITTSYTVLVSNGCIDSITTSVTVLTVPAITISALDSICLGQTDSLKASAVGATSYTWTGGVTCPSCAATGANPIVTTTYSLTVSNGACSKDTSFTIHVKPLPVPGITANPDTICVGDSVHLTGSGGGTYFWPVPGTPNNPIYVKPATNATYTLQVTKDGCTATISKQVIVGANVLGSLLVRNDTICASDSTYLVASGGIAYKWAPSGATTDSIKVKPASNTTYTVVIYSGCSKDTLSKKVNVLPQPVISLSGNTSICAGSVATLTVSGGTSYLWSNGATTTSVNVSPASTHTYTVAVSNGKCTKDTTIVVTVNNPPIISITPPEKLCIGDSVILTVTGGGTYKWSNGATTSSIIVKPNSTTTYSVIVSNGCPGSDSTLVIVDVPVLNACCDKTITPGGADTIVASGSTNYIWTPNINLSCDNCDTTIATPTVTTTYTVTAKDAAGCPVSRRVTVFVETPCSDFIVPNVFTPNNDGRNDDFVINVLNPSFYSISIYDRWGKEVYTSTDPTVYWNGKLMGTQYLVSEGVYYYIIKAACGTNNYVKKGFVQVIGEN